MCVSVICRRVDDGVWMMDIMYGYAGMWCACREVLYDVVRGSVRIGRGCG